MNTVMILMVIVTIVTSSIKTRDGHNGHALLFPDAHQCAELRIGAYMREYLPLAHFPAPAWPSIIKTTIMMMATQLVNIGTYRTAHQLPRYLQPKIELSSSLSASSWHHESWHHHHHVDISKTYIIKSVFHLPTLTSLTLAPTFVTTPASSWPGTKGYLQQWNV